MFPIEQYEPDLLSSDAHADKCLHPNTSANTVAAHLPGLLEHFSRRQISSAGSIHIESWNSRMAGFRDERR